MPRSPRLLVPGTYHVTARGNNSEEIFLDDLDRSQYLELLTKAIGLMAARMFAYVLMDNHVHLVMQTTAWNLDGCIHRVHRPYAAYFNRRYGRTGHLFGGRYRSKPVVDDAHLLESTRYTHLNPVRAGIVRLPEDHSWSSYRRYVEPAVRDALVDPEPVLTLLAKDPDRSMAAYKEFVLAGVPARHPFTGEIGSWPS